jgi:hypothetical protein
VVTWEILGQIARSISVIILSMPGVVFLVRSSASCASLTRICAENGICWVGETVGVHGSGIFSDASRLSSFSLRRILARSRLVVSWIGGA